MFLKAKYIDSFLTQVLSETFSETDTILWTLKFHLNCISDSLKENIQCMIFFNSLHFCPCILKTGLEMEIQPYGYHCLEICLSLPSQLFSFFFFLFLISKIFNSSSHCPPIHHSEQWAVLCYLWSFAPV